MSHDNNPLARGVCSRLDEGIDDLPTHVADRLATARCAALARTTVQRQKTELRFPFISAILSWLDRQMAGSARWIMPAMLVAGIIGFMGYQHYKTAEEQSEFDVDVALLSSDLPLEAYVDRGFSNWVATKSTAQGGTSCGPNC